MELLSLEEERLLYWFGDGNLQNTIKRLQYVGMLATDNDFKKVAFGLSNGKLQTKEYASVYENMFYDILTQHDARKYNREQALKVLLDVLGHEAEYLPRWQKGEVRL